MAVGSCVRIALNDKKREKNCSLSGYISNKLYERCQEELIIEQFNLPIEIIIKSITWVVFFNVALCYVQLHYLVILLYFINHKKCFKQHKGIFVFLNQLLDDSLFSSISLLTSIHSDIFSTTFLPICVKFPVTSLLKPLNANKVKCLFVTGL